MGHNFSRIGVQSQPQLVKHSAAIERPSKKTLQAPQGVIEYDLEFARAHIRTKGTSEFQTYTSLAGVKSVQGSVGLSERSRGPNRISGLKFNFHHQQPACIVGQWMDGSDEFTVDLDHNENIQNLTTWITKDAMSANCVGICQGQVAAIRIETNRGQDRTFCPIEDPNVLGSCLKTQYQASPYQSLVRPHSITNI